MSWRSPSAWAACRFRSNSWLPARTPTNSTHSGKRSNVSLAAVVGGGGPDRPERQRSLEQSLAWSYRLLQPQEQQVLRHAVLFRAPFERAALEGACRDTTPNLTAAVQSLQELGFLAQAARHDHASTARLHVPAGVLEFLRLQTEHASSDPGRDRLGFALWFAQHAAQLDANMHGAEAKQAMAAFDLDRENFLAALQIAHDLADASLVCQMVRSLARYWCQSGSWAVADPWITSGCERAINLTADQALEVLSRAASYWYESQRFERARGSAEHAIQVAESCHDITTQCRMTTLSAGASYHLGQTQRAVDQLHRLCDVAQAAGQIEAYNVAQNTLGNCYLTLGDLSRAASTFLACDAAHGNSITQARTSLVMNLAVVAHYRGRSTQAHNLVAKAISIEQSALPRPARMAMAFARTSWMWCCQGDAEQAEEALDRAQAIAESAQLLAWQRICAAQHGKILLLRGQAHQAESVLARSEAACRNITDPWDVLDISIWLLWAQLQTPDGATRAGATLARIVDNYGRSWCHEHPRILEGAAAWLVTQATFDAAATAWCAAQTLREKQGSKRFGFEKPRARKTQAALRAALGRDWQRAFATRGTAHVQANSLVWLREWALKPNEDRRTTSPSVKAPSTAAGPALHATAADAGVLHPASPSPPARSPPRPRR